MNFKKINNIAGWVLCAIASLVYIMTSEMRGSLWDCGEFVSACFKVQLPHPPGAPLFVLLGRFFIILFGDDPMTAAKAVNVMNALASGFTILFLFWTITHFARKLMGGFSQEPTVGQAVTIIGAGAVGALAYTFSDSFWYSAVEGEVYALSSLFTALAFWIILKWERANAAAGLSRELQNRADRWIIFFFFSLGLSIGIHLLGLLVIPAAVMTYYYNRYRYTRAGAIWAFVIGCLITGVVQVVVIKWSMIVAGKFDILFVNSFNLPFFSGFAFFFVLLGVLVWAGLRWARKNNWSFLRLGLWSFSFMMFGFSSYLTTMIRSSANPSLDMNNVDNPMNLVYYLGREQYGSQPILYGPHFLAQPTGLEETKTRYAKGPDSYVKLAPDFRYTYDKSDYRLFIRTWDASNEQSHATWYIEWLNLDRIETPEDVMVVRMDLRPGSSYIQTQNAARQVQTYIVEDGYAPAPGVRPGAGIRAGDPLIVKVPTLGDNIHWFMSYQMGFMYWRYFMWNFAGKQNDIQATGNKRDGNWISGISFLDNLRLGDQSQLPESIRHNKQNNKLLLLPFILGMIGCVFQFIRNRQDWIVPFLLFFFTGVAIVVYLNQAGNQPRERDYAFSGSFYAFAIWIGLSVVALVRLATEKTDKKTLQNLAIYSGMTTSIILLMADANNIHTGSVMANLLGGVICAGLVYGLTMLVRTAAGKAVNIKNAAIAATLLCLIPAVIMASEEWDDHDRSKKLLAPDLARNYLAGCPENAILFTFGDNDTYPLWYAQEVEGVRPDVRIVNTSLLGIDWYVNQLRYKVNESDPVPLVWSEEQLRGVGYIRNNGDRSNTTQPLIDFLRGPVANVMNAEDKVELKVTFPSRVTIPVDVDYVRQAKLVYPEDQVPSEIVLDLPAQKSYYSLDQLTILNVLATTNWRRPVCFTSPYSELGLQPYLRQIGMIYTVVPVPQADIDLQKSQKLLMNEFRGGNANVKGVYFDEENRRHLLSIRLAYAQTALRLALAGKKDEAISILDKAEKEIHPEALPYAMVSRDNRHNYLSKIYLDAAEMAGHSELANKVRDALIKDFEDQIRYADYLMEQKPDFYSGDIAGDREFSRQMLDQLRKSKTVQPVPENVDTPPNDSDQQQ